MISKSPLSVLPQERGWFMFCLFVLWLCVTPSAHTRPRRMDLTMAEKTIKNRALCIKAIRDHGAEGFLTVFMNPASLALSPKSVVRAAFCCCCSVVCLESKVDGEKYFGPVCASLGLFQDAVAAADSGPDRLALHHELRSISKAHYNIGDVPAGPCAAISIDYHEEIKVSNGLFGRLQGCMMRELIKAIYGLEWKHLEGYADLYRSRFPNVRFLVEKECKDSICAHLSVVLNVNDGQLARETGYVTLRSLCVAHDLWCQCATVATDEERVVRFCRMLLGDSIARKRMALSVMHRRAWEWGQSKSFFGMRTDENDSKLPLVYSVAAYAGLPLCGVSDPNKCLELITLAPKKTAARFVRHRLRLVDFNGTAHEVYLFYRRGVASSVDRDVNMDFYMHFPCPRLVLHVAGDVLVYPARETDRFKQLLFSSADLMFGASAAQGVPVSVEDCERKAESLLMDGRYKLMVRLLFPLQKEGEAMILPQERVQLVYENIEWFMTTVCNLAKDYSHKVDPWVTLLGKSVIAWAAEVQKEVVILSPVGFPPVSPMGSPSLSPLPSLKIPGLSTILESIEDDKENLSPAH